MESNEVLDLEDLREHVTFLFFTPHNVFITGTVGMMQIIKIDETRTFSDLE